VAVLHEGQPLRIESVMKVTLIFAKGKHNLELGSVRLPNGPGFARVHSGFKPHTLSCITALPERRTNLALGCKNKSHQGVPLAQMIDWALNQAQDDSNVREISRAARDDRARGLLEMTVGVSSLR
jgi:hypothetical protein